MSLISLVDEDLAVIYPRLLPAPFHATLKKLGFDFIEIPDDGDDLVAGLDELPDHPATDEARGAGHEVLRPSPPCVHMEGRYLTTGAERGSSTGRTMLPLFEVEPAASQTTSDRQPS